MYQNDFVETAPRGAARLRVHRTSTPKALLFQVTGEVDIYNAAQFAQALQEGDAGAPEAVSVVADLRQLLYIDSAGLAALLRTYTRLARAGGRLWVMLSERSQPARAFGLMRWERAMPVLRSLDDLP